MNEYLERLIIAFDLNDCEAGDLCAYAETLAYRTPVLARDSVRIHARMRAEVLALVGSEVQEVWDGLAR